MVYLDGIKLSTRLYRKPTNKNSLLRFDSYHPTHVRRSLPYSQFLRLQRNCSYTAGFWRESSILIENLTKRQYPDHLQAAHEKAYTKNENFYKPIRKLTMID